ncbi:HAMP domain-containing sensor histidine kinase [Pyruvatibacter sp.]|uniref:sensor histidine kinase n=1 Tax=Pyruvatibacter sp. TaxID=1981328 RepID=UPI0032EBF626
MIPPADISCRQAERSQLGYFVQNMSPTAYMVPMLMCGVAGILMFWAPPWAALVWALAAVSSYLAFYFTCKRFNPAKATQTQFDQWARRVAVLNTISEAVWASMVIWFWVPGDVLNNAFLLGVMAAHLAMAIGHSSIYLPLLYSSLFVPAAALVLRPLSTGDPMLMSVGAVAALYTYFLLMMGKGINRTSTAMLALRDEKDALIHKLETEKVVAEEERSRAEEASQTKSAFLASISHELRTPLNAIIGFSDVMRAETFGALGHDNYKQYADDIHGSGRHLLSLIDDILDLARIEAGRLELDEEPVDLGEIAQECLRMIEISATNRGIKLRADMPKHAPRILADNRAVRQLWLNLASNALKFTDTGGQITLFANITETGTIRFGVDDTGCGMDADELAKVMDAFTQGNSRSRTGERGTGLGLAIVSGLVQAHGGEITLESAVGRGTRATVTLPRARLIINELAPLRTIA